MPERVHKTNSYCVKLSLICAAQPTLNWRRSRAPPRRGGGDYKNKNKTKIRNGCQGLQKGHKYRSFGIAASGYSRRNGIVSGEAGSQNTGSLSSRHEAEQSQEHRSTRSPKSPQRSHWRFMFCLAACSNKLPLSRKPHKTGC